MREQLAQRVGLGQVVVAARVEPDDAVRLARARRREHDGHVARAPKGHARREAVVARQVDVEQHEVERARAQHVVGLLGARGAHDREPLAFEVARHDGGQIRVVVDYEYARHVRASFRTDHPGTRPL